MDRAANIGFTAGSGDDTERFAQVKDKVMGSLKEHFRPEFLNRLDDIIIFEPLSKEALAEIVENQVREVIERLGGKRINLTLSPEVRSWLAEKGYNPQYGARPLKRAIQDHILTPIASLMVGQGIMEGGTVAVSLKGGQLAFDVKKATARGSRAKKAEATVA
jgi:ATP-dependent Clp protease ATP-binding subunit ClpA